MSNKETSNASSGQDYLYKEPDYNSDGNIVKKWEEPESSASEEEEEEDDCVKEGPNSYMALLAEWIARNRKRLIALGLLSKSREK